MNERRMDSKMQDFDTALAEDRDSRRVSKQKTNLALGYRIGGF